MGIIINPVFFSPILFITGRMEMMFEMAVIVILSLFFSLFEAFFVLPAHLGNERVLNPRVLHSKAKGFRKYTERFFTWLRDYAYDRVLKLTLKWRYIVIGVPAAMIVITVGLIGGQLIRTTFFPRMEFDSFNINIAFTPGSGEKQTMEFLTRFDSIVWEVNDELMVDYNDSTAIIENSIVELGSSTVRRVEPMQEMYMFLPGILKRRASVLTKSSTVSGKRLVRFRKLKNIPSGRADASENQYP